MRLKSELRTSSVPRELEPSLLVQSYQPGALDCQALYAAYFSYFTVLLPPPDLFSPWFTNIDLLSNSVTSKYRSINFIAPCHTLVQYHECPPQTPRRQKYTIVPCLSFALRHLSVSAFRLVTVLHGYHLSCLHLRFIMQTKAFLEAPFFRTVVLVLLMGPEYAECRSNTSRKLPHSSTTNTPEI